MEKARPASLWVDSQAVDALQRAADAMMMATESFRRQFHAQDGINPRPATYGAYGAHVPKSSNAATPQYQLSKSNKGNATPGVEAIDPIDLTKTRRCSNRPDPGNQNQTCSYSSQHQLQTLPPALLIVPAQYGRHSLTGAKDDNLLGAHIAKPSVLQSPPATTARRPHAAEYYPSADSEVTAWIKDEWHRGSHHTRAPRRAHTDAKRTHHRPQGHRQSSHRHESGQRLGIPRTLPIARDRGNGFPVVHHSLPMHARLSDEEDDAGASPLITGRARQRRALANAALAASGRPEGVSALQEVLFVLVVCSAQMLMLSGLAQAMVPARVIGGSFPDTTLGTVAWYSAAYSLTAATFVLPSGRLGDLFGHKHIFVVGFLWYGFWSLLAGFAPGVQAAGLRGTVYFCFCRAMQGIGPALLVPNGQALLGRRYAPGKRKNMVMCLFGASAPLGFVVGAVMTSMFATKAWWPWAFWTLAAVCVLLAVVSVLVLPATAAADREDESLWDQLDGYGILLGVTGLVLFNFALNQAPIVSWRTPYTYFILVIGAMLIAAFLWHECYTSRHPLIPVTAMKANTNFVLVCTAAGWACFSIWIYYTIFMLETLRGWSPLLASVSFAHAPVSGLIASLLAGILITRTGPHWIMLVSMCAFFAGSLLLATAPVGQTYWLNTFFGILIMPFGMDMSNPVATILLSNSVSKEHQGIAASLVVTVVNYSISIALGLAGTVEAQVNNTGKDRLVGFRAAQYLGTGIGFLGVLLALCFLLQSYHSRPALPPPRQQMREKASRYSHRES
ncbi:major facilitator superfamily-domain-containing protein [Lasiosphaeris hirsuta]|uniref:Major facilitator superfamily-domain-containing protein n=1 Tax=Lasiosphaeris hirsuta TaxID=260670 RepID=A0AA40AZA8_9PEZI|nr:major facilitator superfamily-domain-containing protein [Lasiosphaeris hirsuta]